jgi:hypothetical protein
LPGEPRRLALGLLVGIELAEDPEYLHLRQLPALLVAEDGVDALLAFELRHLAEGDAVEYEAQVLGVDRVSTRQQQALEDPAELHVSLRAALARIVDLVVAP